MDEIFTVIVKKIKLKNKEVGERCPSLLSLSVPSAFFLPLLCREAASVKTR